MNFGTWEANWAFFGTIFGHWSRSGPSPEIGTFLQPLHPAHFCKNPGDFLAKINTQWPRNIAQQCAMCTSCPLGKMGADETLAAILGLSGPNYQWAFVVVTIAKSSFRSAKASMASQYCFTWEPAANKKSGNFILTKPCQASPSASKGRRRGQTLFQNLSIDWDVLTIKNL